MAVDAMENVAPMFTFKTSGMERPTEYKECITNDLFHQGFFIPPSDHPFESEEFTKFQTTENIKESIKPAYSEIGNFCCPAKEPQPQEPQPMQDHVHGTFLHTCTKLPQPYTHCGDQCVHLRTHGV